MSRVQKRSTESRSDTLCEAYREWLEGDLDTDDAPPELRLGTDDRPEPFVDLIQRDPVVCDSCFLVRYDVVAFQYWGGELGWMDYERWVAHPERSEPVPHELPSHGTHLVCKNCGVAGGIKHRPIPAHHLDEYAENLSSTLRSKGIDHDPDVLDAEIRERNTSENQGKQDSDVFAPALKAAIDAVQGRDEPTRSPITAD